MQFEKVFFPFLLMAAMGLQAQPLIGHDLEASLSPDQGTLRVRDTLSLPEGEDDWTFVLHQGLEPKVVAGEARIESLRSRGRMEAFRLRRQGPGPITLSYAGPLHGDLETVDEGMGRSRQWTSGIISAEGVVLDGNSGWYPHFPDTLQKFSLQVDLPPGWTAVSQGAGPNRAETPQGGTPGDPELAVERNRKRTAPASNRWRVVGLLALAVLLRVVMLSAESLWFDEAYSVAFSSADLSLLNFLRPGGFAFTDKNVYHVILHFWLALGRTEFMIRLLSVLFGVATVGVIIALARRLFGWRAAAWAGAASRQPPTTVRR